MEELGQERERERERERRRAESVRPQLEMFSQTTIYRIDYSLTYSFRQSECELLRVCERYSVLAGVCVCVRVCVRVRDIAC